MAQQLHLIKHSPVIPIPATQETGDFLHSAFDLFGGEA